MASPATILAAIRSGPLPPSPPARLTIGRLLRCQFAVEQIHDLLVSFLVEQELDPDDAMASLDNPAGKLHVMDRDIGLHADAPVSIDPQRRSAVGNIDHAARHRLTKALQRDGRVVVAALEA